MTEFWPALGVAGVIIGFGIGVFWWLAKGASGTHLREIATLREQIKTQDRQLETRDTQLDKLTAAIADAVERIVSANQAQVDRLARLEVARAKEVRAAVDSVFTSKDRDIESWRTAWHITDQAGREELGGAIDEILAATRGFGTVLEEILTVVREVIAEIRRLTADDDRLAGGHQPGAGNGARTGAIQASPQVAPD